MQTLTEARAGPIWG